MEIPNNNNINNGANIKIKNYYPIRFVNNNSDNQNNNSNTDRNNSKIKSNTWN
jgi:hypothetical protein